MNSIGAMTWWLVPSRQAVLSFSTTCPARFTLRLVLGIMAAVMQFPSINGVALVWVVFTIGQLIEGFAVTPWLVGDRIGLHPVAVLFALLAFGQVFGFFGVLLALPVSAAILVGLRHLQAHYRGSSLYHS